MTHATSLIISEPRYSILLRIWTKNQRATSDKTVINLQSSLSYNFTHLCCHDKAGGSGVDGDVAGHQPHILEFLIHLPVFLVGEGLDGTGEDHSLFLSESQCNGIPVRGGHKHHGCTSWTILLNRGMCVVNILTQHTLSCQQMCAQTQEQTHCYQYTKWPPAGKGRE